MMMEQMIREPTQKFHRARTEAPSETSACQWEVRY